MDFIKNQLFELKFALLMLYKIIKGVLYAFYYVYIKKKKLLPNNSQKGDLIILITQGLIDGFSDIVEIEQPNQNVVRNLWKSADWWINIAGYFIRFIIKRVNKNNYNVIYDTIEIDYNTEFYNDYTEKHDKLIIDKWSNFDHNNINESHDILIIHACGGGAVLGGNTTSSFYSYLFHKNLQNLNKNITFAILEFTNSYIRPYPASANDTFTTIKYFIDQNKYKSIYIFGDSGGGLIMFSTFYYMLKNKQLNYIKKINGLIASSPVLSSSRELDGFYKKENEKYDYISEKICRYCMDQYIRDDYDANTNKGSNMLLWDYENEIKYLPPVFLQYGTHEVMYDQINKFSNLLQSNNNKENNKFNEDILQNEVHCSIIAFPNKKSTKDAYQTIGKFIINNLSNYDKEKQMNQSKI